MTDAFPDRLLFHEWSQPDQVTQIKLVCCAIAVWTTIPIIVPRMICAANVHRQLLVSRMIVVDCQADLLEVVTATHPPRRFASRLDRRQQDSNEDTNDRNHDQNLDQRKPGRVLALVMHSYLLDGKRISCYRNDVSRCETTPVSSKFRARS